MLTIRFIDGFDVEGQSYSVDGDLALRRFAPYVASPGMTTYGVQSSHPIGYQRGRSWRLGYTGGGEVNMARLLGSTYSNVLSRGYFAIGPHTNSVVQNITFLRFELGPSGTVVSLRAQFTGEIQVRLGGIGTNAATGSSLLFESSPLSISTTASTAWHSYELRVEAGSGRIFLWLDETLAYTDTGINFGAGFDRVTLRFQTNPFAPSCSMEFDHYVVATDDSAGGESIGASLVHSIPLAADFRQGAWTPNGGSTHFGQLIEVVSSIFSPSPDDDTTYLEGSEASAEDLFTTEEPSCSGYIRAVALNIGAKATTGQPRVRPLVYADGALHELDPSPIAAEATRYAVLQALLHAHPVTGDAWSDRAILESAWGFAGRTPSGTIRITSCYMEKLVDATGIPYDCGGGSYII